MATKISPKFLAPRPLPHYLGSIPKKKYHFFYALQLKMCRFLCIWIILNIIVKYCSCLGSQM